MLTVLDGLRNVNLITVLFRMICAVLCGGAIGLERSYKNRPAGVRTHILICIGGTVASVTGLYLYLNAHLPTDVARLGGFFKVNDMNLTPCPPLLSRRGGTKR